MSKKVDIRKVELLGKEFKTNRCGNCFIVDYKGTDNVLVMFHDPIFATITSISSLNRGNVVNPYHPTVCGVGYIGVGNYSPKDRKMYTAWMTLMTRSYDKRYEKIRPTYKDVTVCNEWHNFQAFAEWFSSQKFSSGEDFRGKSYQLDKDILFRGNKVYSPETCCFVPHEINSLLISCSSSRGENPIGVDLFKRTGKYVSKVRTGGMSRKQLGYFDTAEEAFGAYKEAKESYIKQVAEKWKEKIDHRVYESLMKWEINIDD